MRCEDSVSLGLLIAPCLNGLSTGMRFVEACGEEGCFGTCSERQTLVAVVGNTSGLRLLESELLLEGPCGKWEETDASASRIADVYNTWSCAFGALERFPFVTLK